MENDKVNIIKIYEYFVSDEIIDMMVRSTNSYADVLKIARRNIKSSRIHRWKNTDIAEMKKILVWCCLWV